MKNEAQMTFFADFIGCAPGCVLAAAQQYQQVAAIRLVDQVRHPLAVE